MEFVMMRYIHLLFPCIPWEDSLPFLASAVLSSLWPWMKTHFWQCLWVPEPVALPDGQSNGKSSIAHQHLSVCFARFICFSYGQHFLFLICSSLFMPVTFRIYNLLDISKSWCFEQSLSEQYILKLDGLSLSLPDLRKDHIPWTAILR